MPIPRRDFIKIFGVSLGSLLLARCQRTAESTPTVPPVTCYTIVPPTPTPTSPPAQTPLWTEPITTCYVVAPPAETPTASTGITARGRLQLCWLRFAELAQKTQDAQQSGDESWQENPLGREMDEAHRRILDELVGAGEISGPVSDLIQEAYEAAVFHIWRSNVPMTCYEAPMVDYAPASAYNLVAQSETLAQVAAGGTIPSETLDKIRRALEHDLAFYALTDEEVQNLYQQLLAEYGDPGETPPSFENVALELTPDVISAAAFLVDVLTAI